eukprot:TRINITY_DN17352_c0_g1_i2.p1 TRINITY_DN17352_c0_g1~~TRINITY_DN17352_c0_g1_i2.p1  ORF type:complete len:580 (+),score=75.58 TRINITY_DN17352_c0_g1_i2:110-1849(+)
MGDVWQTFCLRLMERTGLPFADVMYASTRDRVELVRELMPEDAELITLEHWDRAAASSVPREDQPIVKTMLAGAATVVRDPAHPEQRVVLSKQYPGVHTDAGSPLHGLFPPPPQAHSQFHPESPAPQSSAPWGGTPGHAAQQNGSVFADLYGRANASPASPPVLAVEQRPKSRPLVHVGEPLGARPSVSCGDDLALLMTKASSIPTESGSALAAKRRPGTGARSPPASRVDRGTYPMSSGALAVPGPAASRGLRVAAPSTCSGLSGGTGLPMADVLAWGGVIARLTEVDSRLSDTLQATRVSLRTPLEGELEGLAEPDAPGAPRIATPPAEAVAQKSLRAVQDLLGHAQAYLKEAGAQAHVPSASASSLPPAATPMHIPEDLLESLHALCNLPATAAAPAVPVSASAPPVSMPAAPAAPALPQRPSLTAPPSTAVPTACSNTRLRPSSAAVGLSQSMPELHSAVPQSMLQSALKSLHQSMPQQTVVTKTPATDGSRAEERRSSNASFLSSTTASTPVNAALASIPHAGTSRDVSAPHCFDQSCTLVPQAPMPSFHQSMPLTSRTTSCPAGLSQPFASAL